MAKESIVAGATSQSVTVFIQDSSSTVGAGLAGLVYNTSGLIAYYTFTGANASATAITLATLAAVNSAYSSGGFKEIEATNMKGSYRLDIPNAALAASKGRMVTIQLGGASNMAPCLLEVELTGWDNQDGVRGGMTALPNAAANAAGGLPVSIAGSLDLDELNADIEAIQVTTDKFVFTVANQVDSNVLDWKSATAPAMTGDAFARLGAPAGASVSADVASVKTDTGTTIPASIAALNNLSSAQVKTQVVAALNTDTYAEPGQGTPPATATLAQKMGYLFKAWRNRTTQTASQYSLMNDDAVTVDQKATFSDNGTTAERGEQITGP